MLMANAWKTSNRHKIVVISDLHFPRRDSHPKYLYEFLIHNPSDEIIILGDFFEGYDKTLGEFGEWHKRCLDLLHKRKNEEAVQVTVIPGNHDQFLRDPRILNHYVYGALYRRDMVLDGHGGLRTYLTHGDQYDSPTVREFDMEAYQTANTIGGFGTNLTQIYNYFAASDVRLKPKFEKKDSMKVAKKILHGILASARDHECNAVMTGHTHAPQPFKKLTEHRWVPFKKAKKHDWLQYANTGSFTSTLSTAMVLTREDEWRMINWRQQREMLGLQDLPSQSAFNAAQAYRDLTMEEIHFHRTLQTVWVARRTIEKAMRAVDKIRTMTARIEDELYPYEEELQRLFTVAGPEHAPAAGNDRGVPVLAA